MGQGLGIGLIGGALICDYPLLSISLTSPLVSLLPLFSLCARIFDIVFSTIDVRRLITCVGCRRRRLRCSY